MSRSRGCTCAPRDASRNCTDDELLGGSLFDSWRLTLTDVLHGGFDQRSNLSRTHSVPAVPIFHVDSRRHGFRSLQRTVTGHAMGISEEVMKDAPDVTGGGFRASPTAETETGGLAERAMKDPSGVTGDGTTAYLTAKLDNKSLTGKAMPDHPRFGEESEIKSRQKYLAPFLVRHVSLVNSPGSRREAVRDSFRIIALEFLRRCGRCVWRPAPARLAGETPSDGCDVWTVSGMALRIVRAEPAVRQAGRQTVGLGPIELKFGAACPATLG